MAPDSWSSQDQRDFLWNLIDEFREAQHAHKLALFWPKVQNAWFERWKEPGMDIDPIPSGVMDQIEKRKKQITTWFYNNRKRSASGELGVTPPKLLKLGVKQKRTPTAMQLYSTENYKEKVKPIVQSDIKEKNVPKDQKIEVVKQRTAESFYAEPVEIQQSFIDRSAKMKEERAREKNTVPATPTPETYAAEINNLPKLLKTLISDLSTRTGWSFLILTGGPDPSIGGKLRTACMHEGRNELGHSFPKCYPSFEDDYVKPFANFLKQVYPPSVREARSLHGKIHSADTHEETSTNVPMMPPSSPVYNAAQAPVGSNIIGLGNLNAMEHVDEVISVTHVNSPGPQSNKSPRSGDVDSAVNHERTNDDESWLDPSLRSRSSNVDMVDRRIHDNDDDESWLDPSLRSAPVTIVNNAAPIDDVSLTHQGEDDEVDTMGENTEIQSNQPAEESNERNRRQRRPAASKEVVPVIARDKSWLCDSHTCLSENDYGPLWSECIALWSDFEQRLPLVDLSSMRLPATKSRPQELSQWLAKRNYAHPPAVEDKAAYANHINEWLDAMKNSTKKKTSSFDHLRKGGPNGIVTLLLGLKLWRMNIEIEKEDEWNGVVADVGAMFKSFSGNGTKRKESPVAQSSNTQKRRK